MTIRVELVPSTHTAATQFQDIIAVNRLSFWASDPRS